MVGGKAGRYLRLTMADCAALLRPAATDYRCHRPRICLQEGLARCAKWHRYRHAYRVIRRRGPPAHGTPRRSQPAQVRNLAGSGPQLACERWGEGSPGALDAGSWEQRQRFRWGQAVRTRCRCINAALQCFALNAVHAYMYASDSANT